MKQFFKAAISAVQTAWYKTNLFLLTAMGMAYSGSAMALIKEDMTADKSGGKKFDTVAENLDGASQTMAALLIQFVSVGGFVVVAVSLFQLYKASKDEREKPMSAVVGLFIGGAMAAVGTIMWVMRNTITEGTGGGATP